jgi:hypothetical protein
MKTKKHEFFCCPMNHLHGSPSGIKTYIVSPVLLLLLIIFEVSAFSQGPAFMSLYATSGSLAPWGLSQGVVIDAAGNAKVYQSDYDLGTSDSASVTLTAAQMQAIVDTAVAAGFFSLNSLYDNGAIDGTKVRVEINTSSTSKNAEVRNMCVGAMNRVVRTINSKIVNSKGFQLGYNFMNDNCP